MTTERAGGRARSPEPNTPDRTRAMLHGAAYALRRDPDYPDVFQLAVRSSDGSVGAGRLDRDQLRILLSDAMGSLQQVPLAIERSDAAVLIAGAIQRDLELLRDLWIKGDPAAEVLIKSLIDHLKSWQPSLTAGTALL
jgi:hypothetical protein